MKQISANPTNWAFFHPDQVGSVSLITNGQGLLIAQISHRPFGGIDQAHSVGSPEALKNWASYTGQEMDPETGLIYYQFRYYDPSLRRFLSPDNSTPKGPSVSQTYNRYAYVQNNPINFNDPTGHKGCGIVKFICDAANDVADGLKSAGKAVAETVKTVGATASAAVTASVRTAQAQINNTPLVRSIDNRRAEVTHILGLDNTGPGILNAGDEQGKGYCWQQGNCITVPGGPIGDIVQGINDFGHNPSRYINENILGREWLWDAMGGVALGAAGYYCAALGPGMGHACGTAAGMLIGSAVVSGKRNYVTGYQDRMKQKWARYYDKYSDDDFRGTGYDGKQDYIDHLTAADAVSLENRYQAIMWGTVAFNGMDALYGGYAYNAGWGYAGLAPIPFLLGIRVGI